MKSESIKELTAALAKAQISFKPIKRTEKVDYATTGGRKKYNYAPLDEVIEATKKALSDNGLAITQSTYLQSGNVILETLLSHSSGEWLSSELYVGKQDQPPQSEGSSLTYKRRYGMSAILCVSSEEDDDAEGTTGAGEEKKQPDKVVEEKHWCSVHNTEFFTRGKMKSFAHPVEGQKEWCYEPKAEVTADQPPAVTEQLNRLTEATTGSKKFLKELYDLVKRKKPACKSDRDVESWLSGVMKIDLARLETEPEKVLAEVKAATGW